MFSICCWAFIVDSVRPSDLSNCFFCVVLARFAALTSSEFIASLTADCSNCPDVVESIC